MKSANAPHPATPARQRRPARAASAAVAAGERPLPDGADNTPSAASLPDGETRDAMIHRLAYARYVDNGCTDGHALEDWLAAEAAVGSLSLGGDTARDAGQPAV